MKASWKTQYKKAITFSYDDGVTQDIRLIELLNRYGLKATFNLNSELLGHPGMLIREGQRIDARQTGKEWEELTIKEIRECCNVPFTELSKVLHEEFNRCFDVKKKSKRITSRKRNTST